MRRLGGLWGEMMQKRYASGATPSWTISLYWHEGSKVWVLLLQDSEGRVVERQTAETRVPLDRASARLLLRAATAELEMLLPL